jgi:hypothetical protein
MGLKLLQELLKMYSAVLAVSLSAVSLVCFAQAPCDLDLIRQTNPQDSDRYLARDKDRCEGVYLQQVSATVGELLVASLTASGGGPAQWPASGALALRWNQSSSGDVHIQAFPLVPRKHFRLDVLRGEATTYDWNTILVKRYLAPSETGLVAWTIAPVNGRKQRIYLPITVGSSEAPKGPYRLTLVPPVELSEVYLTVASVAPGDRPLRFHVPLKLGSRPANQRIDIDLPPLPKAGLYRVEVVGDRKDQGSVSTPPFLVNEVQ